MVRRSTPAGANGLRRATPGRFVRTRALLAGALVLGVGGSLTLASWSDQELASGSFGASTFGIVGSPSAAAPAPGNTFAEHPSTPATLSFTAPATGMSPGTTVYARYAVKTTAATTVDGTLALGGATGAGTGLGPLLRYGVKVIPMTSTCDATSYAASSTVIVPTGSLLTVAGSSTQPVLKAGGSVVPYCFAVTLPAGTANTAQGLTTNATWAFTATSTE